MKAEQNKPKQRKHMRYLYLREEEERQEKILSNIKVDKAKIIIRMLPASKAVV